MAAHRINGRGTLVVDRQFAGVGRVRRASGTQDKREFRAINDLLSTLFQRRRLDYLRAVRDGSLHPMDLLLKVQEHGLATLDLLPSPQALTAIKEEWTAWVDATPKANTRRMYALAWTHVAAHLPERGTLADLAPALLALRKVLRDKPPTFNRTRASVQAFVKQKVGTRDPAYLALEGVEKLSERPMRRDGLPLDEVLAIQTKLPEKLKAVWWHLALSGMRVGEFYAMDGATWSREGDTLKINGVKTENAIRVIPRLDDITPPAAPLRLLRAELRKHGVSPHVARYSFKVMVEDAGIPANRAEQYLGRSPKGMSGLYSRVQLAQWVAQDRPVLLEYIALAKQRAKGTVRTLQSA